MLHLHTLTIPSVVSDTSGLVNTRFEDADSVDGFMTDGMELIFNLAHSCDVVMICNAMS